MYVLAIVLKSTFHNLQTNVCHIDVNKTLTPLLKFKLFNHTKTRSNEYASLLIMYLHVIKRCDDHE